jgi:hypothetical protein
MSLSENNLAIVSITVVGVLANNYFLQARMLAKEKSIL